MTKYMYVVISNEEMASYFITETCQLLSKSFTPSSDHMHDLAMATDYLTKGYAIYCGSEAEFYIRPLNKCIAYSDYLLARANQLSFSGDIPVLPSDRSGLVDSINCYEIVSYREFPGFVRLRHFGELMYNWKHMEYKLKRKIDPDKCSYIATDRIRVLNAYVDQWNDEFKSTLPNVFCGPAIKTRYDTDFGTDVDTVYCLFCPHWPKNAHNWPLRLRNNGWPTSETISEVVGLRNGCHVVYVQHRACKNDIYQWRWSFSIGEVILLHSWTKTQLIVYHLLRFFAKKELIEKDCSKEDEILCSYHLKTLMLWTCEEMSAEW